MFNPRKPTPNSNNSIELKQLSLTHTSPQEHDELVASVFKLVISCADNLPAVNCLKEKKPYLFKRMSKRLRSGNSVLLGPVRLALDSLQAPGASAIKTYKQALSTLPISALCYVALLEIYSFTNLKEGAKTALQEILLTTDCIKGAISFINYRLGGYSQTIDNRLHWKGTTNPIFHSKKLTDNKKNIISSLGDELKLAMALEPDEAHGALLSAIKVAAEANANEEKRSLPTQVKRTASSYAIRLATLAACPPLAVLGKDAGLSPPKQQVQVGKLGRLLTDITNCLTANTKGSDKNETTSPMTTKTAQS